MKRTVQAHSTPRKEKKSTQSEQHCPCRIMPGSPRRSAAGSGSAQNRLLLSVTEARTTHHFLSRARMVLLLASPVQPSARCLGTWERPLPQPCPRYPFPASEQRPNRGAKTTKALNSAEPAVAEVDDGLAGDTAAKILMAAQTTRRLPPLIPTMGMCAATQSRI